MIKIICIVAIIALSSCHIQFLKEDVETVAHASNASFTLYRNHHDGSRHVLFNYIFSTIFSIETDPVTIFLTATNSEELREKLKNFIESISESFLSGIVYADEEEGTIQIDTSSHYYFAKKIEVERENNTITALLYALESDLIAEIKLTIDDEEQLSQAIHILAH